MAIMDTSPDQAGLFRCIPTVFGEMPGSRSRVNRAEQRSHRAIVAIRGIMAAAILVIISLATGCAVRPMVTVPPDMTAERAFSLVGSRASSIRDFTGTALVRGIDGDASGKSVKLSIRYLAPDRYRVLAKAFAGIPVGVMTADQDSVTMFFPSDNAFITLGRHDEGLLRITDGYGLDFDMIASVLTGFSLPSAEADGYRKTLERRGKRTMLVLDNGTTKYSLLLEGSECRVVEETVEQFGSLTYSKRASRFKTIGGVPVPGRVKVETGRGVFDIELDDCALNSNLTGQDVSFAVPPTAERLSVKDITGVR